MDKEVIQEKIEEKIENNSAGQEPLPSGTVMFFHRSMDITEISR